MKITCLLISIIAATLGFAAAAGKPKTPTVLSSKDVPVVVREMAAKEAGSSRITKYKRLPSGNVVADAGNGKDRKLLEFTYTGTYLGYSQPMTMAKLPDVIRKRYINTMERKDCPTCPMVVAQISTLKSCEKVTPAGATSPIYRCTSSLRGQETTTDFDESGQVVKNADTP